MLKIIFIISIISWILINSSLFKSLFDSYPLSNIILNSEEYNPVADLNSDGTIDILDIVQLVNVILN